MVAYLGAGLAALGALPTQDRIVIERVFDESEGTQLIVHSPYGGRINRALGLALRKRFCVSFDFELQAAADDDTVVLSLGPQHSFPLARVPKMLQSGTVTEVLTQAILTHPMLAARWRWNLNRALVVPRSRGGQRRPIHLQRMEADDLLAAAWPALAACQENAAPGPLPVADHVLVRQTVDDCLTEPLDAAGLVALLEELEAGRVEVHLVESTEASPLAHGILNGRPFTFLDGAPLEERRTRAVPIERGLGPIGPNGLPGGTAGGRVGVGPPRRRRRRRGARTGAAAAAGSRRVARAPLRRGAVPSGRRLAAVVRACWSGTVGPAWSTGRGRRPSAWPWPKRWWGRWPIRWSTATMGWPSASAGISRCPVR